MKLEPNTSVSHYKILSSIGKGGMGEVYLAQDTELNRKVAIKFLSEELSKDAEKVNRFVQEAQAASALNHPSILTVHEIGKWEDTRYIATEYIEGETLRDIIRRKEPIALNRILKIGIQVAEALSAAHRAGIAHRDIKPENIMVREDGYVKVLDFGLAKLTERKSAGESLSLEGETKALVKTNPGVVMGTVSYMSPEQARGQETDVRTDIWSLGVVLYEMLSGKVPFAGETTNHAIVAILENEPKLLEDIPDELQRIVRKTLTKDRSMRYQNTGDLVIDLKNLRRDLDIQGELERSVVPNRYTESGPADETQVQRPVTAEAANVSTQNLASTSSLEYAVIQAKTHKLAAAVITVLLVGIVSAAAYFAFLYRSSDQIDSIAVMPFVNEGGNTDVEYLSDGMTETLISSLSKLPNLSVKGRSTVFRYKGKDVDTKTLGKELGVQAVLYGRVIQRGDQLSLSLELLDALTENVIWSGKYDRKQADVVSLQSEIARDVSNKLQSKLSGAEVEKVEKSNTANPEAYRLYLQGRFYWNRRTEADLKKSIGFFEKTIALDPGYALAYSGLADAYGVMPNYTSDPPPEETYPKARTAAQKALELDPDLAEPHATLGYILHEFEWNQAEAEKEFKRAIELDPNYPSAHQWYGEYLSRMGRFAEAIAEQERALELDPLSLIINVTLGNAYRADGRYDDAIAQYNKALEIDPSFVKALGNLFNAYIDKGLYEEAFKTFARIRLLRGNPPEEVEKGTANAIAVYRRSGARGFWQMALEQSEKRARETGSEINPFDHARAQLGAGKNEDALSTLEKALASGKYFGSMVNLKESRGWAPLRDEPRFKAILRKVGLPE
jgi:serine/threonine-protein kinase